MNKDNPEAFDLERVERFGDEIPPDTKKRMLTAIQAQKSKMSADEILMALHGKGYDQPTFEAAAARPVSEYKRVLKKYEAKDLGSLATFWLPTAWQGTLLVAPPVQTVDASQVEDLPGSDANNHAYVFDARQAQQDLVAVLRGARLDPRLHT